MAKADLHVHSCFSARPSEWFLQRIGTKESYTDPETIYHEAKRRGMDFVTITDHNEIAASIILTEKYPADTFTGVEVTTYFPENGCKIHVLVHDLTERQFHWINKIRHNIYDFRDYIREQRLSHAVAHATFSINKKLSLEYLERLFLLFDCFEGINGSRNRMANIILMDAVEKLNPARIGDLYGKYRIEPFSDVPWEKGVTGGSDDHSGLFIGRTYTDVEANTVEGYVDGLKEKSSCPGGRHNDYQGLAFAIYKVAYDHSKSKSGTVSPTLFSAVNDLIFEKKSFGLRNRLMLERLKMSKDRKENEINQLLLELIETFRLNRDLNIDTKLALVYDKIADIADEFFKKVTFTIEDQIARGDIIAIISQISRSVPGIFLSLPFFSTVNVLSESRAMINELAINYGSKTEPNTKRILVFADMMDGNDSSWSLENLFDTGKDLYGDAVLVTCSDESSAPRFNHSEIVDLPCVHRYEMSFLNGSSLRVPSVLKSLKVIYELDPDEIVVLTPGPVGLLGLLTARLLHVSCTAIHHTDLTERVNTFIGDARLEQIVEDFSRWFFSTADTVVVTDGRYVDILEDRGYPREKMAVLNGDSPHDVMGGAVENSGVPEKARGLAAMGGGFW